MGHAKCPGLSGNALKIIAIITMFIDHMGLLLFPQCMPLRVIGRLAFPIFSFMIAEGCLHTHNRARYLGRIFVLGAVCQLVSTIFGDESIRFHQGILLTFSIAIAIIYSIDGLKAAKRPWSESLFVVALLALGFILIGLPRLFAEHGFKFDYGTLGALLPVALYYLRHRTARLIATAAFLAGIACLNTPIQFFSLLSLPLLALYTGKLGKWKLKYLFYVFYPSHLVFLYLIAYLVARFAH